VVCTGFGGVSGLYRGKTSLQLFQCGPGHVLDVSAAVTRLCVSSGRSRYAESHDLGRGTPLAEEPGHEFHGGIDVGEERLVPLAQVVEARVPCWCVDEAVPGAAAVAGEPDVALEAVSGKGVAFRTPEGLLFLGCDEFEHRCFGDVAQQVVRLDVVVACVQVAVVFHRQGKAAGLCKDAQPARFAVPRAECDVEVLDEDLPDVGADPLVEDGYQEPPERSGVDAAVGDMMPLLHVQGSLAAVPVVFPGGPAEARERQQRLGDPFNDRDELDELHPHLVTEEAVHVEGMILVGCMDGAQHVDVDVAGRQRLVAGHDPIEAALSLLVEAVRVVELAGTVDGETDEEPVLLEECRPIIRQAGPVRLNRVRDLLAGSAVLLDQFDRAAEEVEAHHGGLPTLPSHHHLGCHMGFEELSDVGLEQVVCHPEPVPRVEHLLGEEEAVGTVEIADRARRLGEEMERRGCVLRRQHGRARVDMYPSAVADGTRRSPPSRVSVIEGLGIVFIR